MSVNCRMCAVLFVLGPSLSFGQQPATKTVEIRDGVVLNYIERGTGEPVIFIHGLTGDYSIWQAQVQAFSRSGYRAIAYSRRYNHPNRNPMRPNHSATVEADDLASMIQKLELKKVHVVGHSYGAYTALMLGLRNPKLVRTLTIAEAPIVGWLRDLDGPGADAARAQSRKLFTQGVLPARAAIEAGNDELAIQSMIDAISGNGTFARIPPPAKARIRRNVNEMKAILRSQNAYPPVMRNQVRNLTMPTLLLSGTNTIATARYTDPELWRLLPEKTRKRVALPGATHMMWLEQPEQSRRAVLDFIRAAAAKQNPSAGSDRG